MASSLNHPVLREMRAANCCSDADLGRCFKLFTALSDMYRVPNVDWRCDRARRSIHIHTHSRGRACDAAHTDHRLGPHTTPEKKGKRSSNSDCELLCVPINYDSKLNDGYVQYMHRKLEQEYPKATLSLVPMHYWDILGNYSITEGIDDSCGESEQQSVTKESSEQAASVAAEASDDCEDEDEVMHTSAPLQEEKSIGLVCYPAAYHPMARNKNEQHDNIISTRTTIEGSLNANSNTITRESENNEAVLPTTRQYRSTYEQKEFDWGDRATETWD